MAGIVCPSCGRTNKQDREFCFYCQTRLDPQTKSNPSAGSSDQAGNPPGEKAASGSEPLVPEWLQKSRSDLQKSILNETGEPSGESAADFGSQDLLAGLRSKAEDEDNALPEWFANITGEGKRVKKTSAVFPGLGTEDEAGSGQVSEPDSGSIPATQVPKDLPDPDAKRERDSLPGWLAQLQASTDQGGDELSDWLEKARSEPAADVSEPPAAVDFGYQDSGPREVPQAPDRFAGLQPFNEEGTTLGSGLDRRDELEARMTGKSESDDEWLARLGSQAGEQQDLPAEPSKKLPPWLRYESPSPAKPESLAPDVPEWLQSASPKASVEDAAARERAESEQNLDWLRSEFPEVPVEDELVLPPPAEAQEPAPMPAIKPAQPPVITPPAKAPVPADAFTKDSLSDKDMDSLFTELPDWLSKPGPDQMDSSVSASAGAGPEAISPASLPNWVQAMRPVEQIPRRASAASDQTFESKGVLAGLQGVLPTVQPPIRSVVPTKGGIKLNVSDEQRSHASLLERILQAETIPQPVKSMQRISIQKLLGWTISSLLIVLVTGLLLTGSRVFRLPIQWPVAATSALQVVESFPENSAVLVIVDYEPARSAELEAAAVPLLDHMILLRHPRLALISTRTTGNLLAEKLITDSFLAGHNYQLGNQVVNLGYLPGGLTGVLAFAQEPAAAKPLDFNNRPAWNSAALQGVTHFSDFAGLILLTDEVDSARSWIEQGGAYRGSTPFVLVSSAQAAPMLQPYVDSRQVAGLVGGLSGAAILEQNNAGRPGTARIWWDTYSLGLIIAAAMIFTGGAWNLIQGIRTRWSGEPV